MLLLWLKEIQLSLLKIIIVAKLFSFVFGKPIYYQHRASIDCCSKIAHPWPTANLILQCDNKWIKFSFFSVSASFIFIFCATWFFLSSSVFFPSIFAKAVCHYSKNWIYFSSPDHFRFIFISVFGICVVCSCSFHDVHARTFKFAVCCVLIVFVNDSYCVCACLPVSCHANGTERAFWTTYSTHFLVLMMLLVCNNSVLMNNEHWCVRDMN